jgi:class 3 adenylate cyclase
LLVRKYNERKRMQNKVLPTVSEESETDSDVLCIQYKYQPSILEYIKSIRTFVLMESLLFIFVLVLITVLWSVGQSSSTKNLSTESRRNSMAAIHGYLSTNLQGVEKINTAQAAILRDDFELITANGSFAEAQRYVFAYWATVAKLSRSSKVQVDLYIYDQTTADLYNSTDGSQYMTYLGYRGIYNSPTTIEQPIYWPSVTNSNLTVYYNVSLTNGKALAQTRTTKSPGTTSRLVKTALATVGNSTTAWTDAFLDTRSCVEDPVTKITSCPVRVAHVASLFNSNGKLKAFVAYTYTGDVLETFLQTYTMQYGVSFLVEKSTNLLLATSDATVNVAVNGASSTLLSADKCSNLYLVKCVTYLKEKLPRSSMVTGFVNVRGARVDFTARTLVFSDKQWMIVSYAKQWNTLRKIYIVFIVCIVISAVSIIVGLAVSFIAARAISKPLYSVIQQFMQVEDMKLESILESKDKLSSFSEIAAIQSHFFDMVETLVEYRSFLPEHVLKGKMEDKVMHTTQYRMRPSLSTNRLSTDAMTRTASTGSYTGTGTDTGTGKRSSGRAANDLRFALALEDKIATVLFIRIPEFYNGVYRKHNHYEIVEAHGNMLQKISHVVEATKGQLISFNEYSFCIIWNGCKRLKNHATLGCRAALELRQYVASSSENEHLKFRCKMGLYTGETTIGNVGYLQRRQQIAFGKSYMMAKQLSKLTQDIPATVIISEETFKQINKEEFRVRPVGFFKATNFGSEDEVRIYELVESINKLVDNEWIYALEKEKEAQHHDTFSEAFELYASGDTDKALELFNEYEELDRNKGNTDPIVYYMIQQCQQVLATSNSSNCHLVSQSSSTMTQVLSDIILQSPGENKVEPKQPL